MVLSKKLIRGLEAQLREVQGCEKMWGSCRVDIWKLQGWPIRVWLVLAEFKLEFAAAFVWASSSMVSGQARSFSVLCLDTSAVALPWKGRICSLGARK